MHRLRAEVDAIAVGVGTVIADDPQLTARTEPPAHAPAAARRLRPLGRTPQMPGSATTRPRPSITADSPAEVLADLHARGVVSVLLEGGPTLAGGFWEDGLIDKVVGYVAPALLGSGRFRPCIGGGIDTIDAAGRLVLDDVTRFGDDVRLTSYPEGNVTDVFTGIVEELGEVLAVEAAGFGGAPDRHARSVVGGDAQLGDSISVNGVCLTVTGWDDDAGDRDVTAALRRHGRVAAAAPASAGSPR